jgi:hypothetical protein
MAKKYNQDKDLKHLFLFNVLNKIELITVLANVPAQAMTWFFAKKNAVQWLK